MIGEAANNQDKGKQVHQISHHNSYAAVSLKVAWTGDEASCDGKWSVALRGHLDPIAEVMSTGAGSRF